MISKLITGCGSIDRYVPTTWAILTNHAHKFFKVDEGCFLNNIYRWKSDIHICKTFRDTIKTILSLSAKNANCWILFLFIPTERECWTFFINGKVLWKSNHKSWSADNFQHSLRKRLIFNAKYHCRSGQVQQLDVLSDSNQGSRVYSGSNEAAIDVRNHNTWNQNKTFLF